MARTIKAQAPEASSSEGISPEAIAEANERLGKAHQEDLEALERQLRRRGFNLEEVIRQAMRFSVALPSWAFTQGGTRFGRFPAEKEPTTIEEKLRAAAIVNDLTRVCDRVALHIPWDRTDDLAALRKLARRLGLKFDAMNSNTFQDQPGQGHSYKFGSLCHTNAAVRRLAIEHNLECIRIGQELGSQALIVWLGDGGNFPGQHHLRRALDRTIDSLENIYSMLPSEWRLLVEYKPFEPAFYSTVVQDWGTALLVTQSLGSRAQVLVDLGHHLPGTNVEQVVARLISCQRLGGFHFNDSKFADDDLSTASINPYELFLVFNELLDAVSDPLIRKGKPKLDPAYMIDQSPTIKDPVEDLVTSAIEIHRARTKALLIDGEQLNHWQEQNDPTMAEDVLKRAYETDVSPILAEARRRKGGAIEPLRVLRSLGKGRGR